MSRQVQELVDALLSAEAAAPAVFAAADTVATVVYRAAAVREVRVGRDISVISGNNDQALIASLYPSLTTLDIHAEQVGREAAMRLGQLLARGQNAIAAELLLEPTLVAGESVCRAGGSGDAAGSNRLQRTSLLLSNRNPAFRTGLRRILGATPTLAWACLPPITQCRARLHGRFATAAPCRF